MVTVKDAKGSNSRQSQPTHPATPRETQDSRITPLSVQACPFRPESGYSDVSPRPRKLLSSGPAPVVKSSSAPGRMTSSSEDPYASHSHDRSQPSVLNSSRNSRGSKPGIAPAETRNLGSAELETLVYPPSLLAHQSLKSPERNDNERKNSNKRPRHVSLQSRVESMANKSSYSQPSMIEIPSAYPQALLPWEVPVYISPGVSPEFDIGSQFPRLYDPQPPDDGYFNKPLPLPKHERVSMTMLREILFVGTVAVSHLMTQAALGQALAPIDIIAAGFGTTNPGQMSWFIAAYSLSVGTFILISGRLGDILGNSRVFCFGYAWLGVWSCFAGFSIYPKKQIFFDVCRAMQGIGPALLLPNALALFGRAYQPGIRKNIVFSIFGALAPAGFVAGATFGSIFSQLAWWPWAFWSFGFACFGLATLAMLVIPSELTARPKHPPGFDFTGSLIGVAGLILVNVAWNNAPLYGWGTPHVYFVLIIGILCLVAFLWVERRAEHPILPIHAINSTVAFVLALVGVGWGSFGVWVFYVWRFLEKVRQLTPLEASSQFAPAVICGFLAAGMTGFMLTHTPVSFVMMLSMMAFLTGLTIAATMPVHQHYWSQLFISILVMPFGMDMSFPAATVILSNHMPREHQGLAGSLVNTVVNYSISIALGIAGTVEVTMTNKSIGASEFVWGLRCALYTGVGLASMGVLLGILFFIHSMIREGWKVMDH